MPAGDASFVHLPLAEFLAVGRVMKEKWKQWEFTVVKLEFAGAALTITSGAGIHVLPARGKLAASAQLTSRNFMRIVNSLGTAKTPKGELDLAFLPAKKQLLTDKVKVKAEVVFTW